MPSADGHDGHDGSSRAGRASDQTLETMLFESLVHHLIEKGLLTKNDALSVIETVAQVKMGQRFDGETDGSGHEAELAVLRRMFDSFDAMRERPASIRVDGANVRQLRPPLHGDSPNFPDTD